MSGLKQKNVASENFGSHVLLYIMKMLVHFFVSLD